MSTNVVKTLGPAALLPVLAVSGLVAPPMSAESLSATRESQLASFRRAYGLIRGGGNLGLTATKTIAQGGTREGSLEPTAIAGGEIVFAVRSMK